MRVVASRSFQPALRAEQPRRARRARRLSTLVRATEVADASPEASDASENGAASEFADAYNVASLSLDQVQELISTISDETNIAEVHLKLQDMEVRFRRSSGAAAAHLSAAPAGQAVYPGPLLPMPAEAAPKAPAAPTDSLDEDSSDLAVVGVKSSKVGIFRAYKYINTRKVGRQPLISGGDWVKETQPMGFIEQLGTFSPITAPMDGAVADVLLQDGDPVEYDQTLFNLVPSMPTTGSRIKA